MLIRNGGGVVRARLIAAGCLMLLAACGGGVPRRSDVEQQPPRRLDGDWTLSLRLERGMSLASTPATLPFTLRGTLTMMMNQRADVSFASITAPTQIGVYALRLDSLGLAPWQAGDVPTVAARELNPSSPATSRDSIVIVLNPAMPTRLVRLTGAFAGDVARGTWTAESPLGGGGTFEMRHVATVVRTSP